LVSGDINNSYFLFMKMAHNSYFALMRMGPGTRSYSRTASMKLPQRHLDADQHGTRSPQYFATRSDVQKKGCEVFSIVIMLLLLVGFYGLFVGLVFFSQGVIEPDSTL
jgi:hypothetical protein